MEIPRPYPAEHYRRNASRYVLGLRCLFNVRVDQTTHERWSDLIGFYRVIDTYLDEGDRATLAERTEDIIRLLEESEVVAERFPSLSPEQFGEESYAKLSDLLNGMLQTNLQIKSTTSLKEYVTLRRRESRLYARLISMMATPEVASQRGYERFSRWLLPTGEVTNLINSFTDIHEDHAKGEILLTPDRMTRPRLLGHMALVLAQARHTANSENV